MRAVLEIARKDLRLKVRDRSAILLTIVAPFVLAAVFSLLLGGMGEGFSTRWGYADMDGGEIAAALVDGPLAALESAGTVSLARLDSPDEAEAAVSAGQVDAAIVVPPGLSDAVTGAGPASLDLLVSPDQAISGQVAAAVLSAFTSRLDAVRLSVATTLMAGAGSPGPAETERIAALAAAEPDPVGISARAVGDRSAPWASYFASAMSVLFVFFAAQFGVSSLLAERREGTLSRMLAAPLRPETILAGKVVVSLVLGVVSMSVMALGTSLLLGAAWGHPVGVAGLILGAATAATGISLLVVGFARDEEQAGNLTAIVSMVLAVLGGSFVPLSQAPEILLRLGLLTPHAWFLRGTSDLATGGDVRDVVGPVAVLAGVGVVTGAVGLWRARRRMVGR